MVYPPEQQKDYQREWIRKRRASFLDGKSCEWCGSRQRLELDHIDRTQKVSHRIWSWSAERRAAEIAKCQVLCHNCHKVKTYTVDRPLRPCGTWASYRRGCRCAKCREANNVRVRAQRARKRAAAAA